MSILFFSEQASRIGLRILSSAGNNTGYRIISSSGLPNTGLRIQSGIPALRRTGLRVQSDILSQTRTGLRILGDINASGKISTGFRIISALGSDIPIATFSINNISVYLDGIDLFGKYESFSITLDQDTIHDTIDINLTDPSLFHLLRDGNNHVLKVVGLYSGDLEFQIDKPSGNERQFRAWGRSLSALESPEIAQPISYYYDDYRSAQETANEILSACALQWDIDDFLLPPGISFYGISPIEALQRIASTVGAIVRAGYGNQIIVRKRYPTRPININSVTANIDYDDIENIFDIGVDRELGEGYNSIRISGYSPAGDDFSMELEDTNSRYKGDDAIIRIYWPKEDIPEQLSTYTTQGLVEFLGDKYEELTEELTFIDGKASVSRPILRVESIKFYPDVDKNINFTPWETEIFIDDNYALADITYVTRYQRFRVHSHFIEKLLVAISAGNTDEEVYLWIADETENEAPAIVDEYLVSLEAKKTRGIAELDELRYDKEIIGLDVPFFPETKDGNIAFINDSGVNIIGNTHIKSVNINVDLIEITSNIEVIKWLH